MSFLDRERGYLLWYRGQMKRPSRGAVITLPEVQSSIVAFLRERSFPNRVVAFVAMVTCESCSAPRGTCMKTNLLV